MFAIRPFTEGMIPVATPAAPIWHFEGRCAANRAFFRAAQEGKSGEDIAWWLMRRRGLSLSSKDKENRHAATEA